MSGNLSSAEVLDDGYDEADGSTTPEPLGLAPDVVEVRRNAGLAALVGGVASAVAIAYFARATGTGSVLDWCLFAVMGLLGVAHLASFVDARTPLLVADTQGVRIRLGHTWRGLPWGALSHVEHTPRRGLLRDGRLVLVARNPERALEELDPRGRRQSRLAERLYGAPFAVPLALSTRVTGAGDDLTEALSRLAGESALVVEVSAPEVSDEEVLDEPEQPAAASAPDLTGDHDRDHDRDHDEPDEADEAEVLLVDEDDHAPLRRWHDPRPALAHGIGAIAARLQRPGRDPDATDVVPDHDGDAEQDAEPATERAAEQGEPTVVLARADGLVASATPSPLREPRSAQRAEVRRDVAPADGDDVDATGARELRRPGSVSLVEDTQVWGDRVRPISRGGDAVEPLVIDEFAVEPAEDPVIGPELSAARTRLGLTVDQLADRTRIRPHVIESIEVDDFAPCGGDFYARGHLRTLARVLGIDVAPLLASYDERYADAPINPRRVFEAELATGAHGSIRGTRGGPNWSVLIAAVMALVLAWSIARLVMDSPVELQQPAPILNGSHGLNNSAQQLADPVPVEIRAAGGGAHVVVRNGAGQVVFQGNLPYRESKTLKVAPPVRVQSSDGSLETTVDGQPRGALGAAGQPAQDTYPLH